VSLAKVKAVVAWTVVMVPAPVSSHSVLAISSSDHPDLSSAANRQTFLQVLVSAYIWIQKYNEVSK